MRTKEELFGILKRDCEERMEDLFPKGIPQDIQSRYEREFDRFRKTDAPEELYIYRVLSDLADSMQAPLIVQGTARNSLLTYLVGDGLVNPMRPYYYCKGCGHYERIPDHIYGVDAVSRFCLECGELMHGEGFSLDERFVWGIDDTPKRIHFEYGSISGFSEEAKRLFSEIGFNFNTNENTHILLVESPFAQSLYDRYQSTGIRRNMRIHIPLPSISKWKKVYPKGFLSKDERELIRLMDPRCYEDLVIDLALSRNLMRATVNGYVGHLTSSCDDLFRELVHWGNSVNRAYEIAEFVSKGHAANPKRRQEWESLCTCSLLPLDLKEVCERCDNLWPEANILDKVLQLMRWDVPGAGCPVLV